MLPAIVSVAMLPPSPRFGSIYVGVTPRSPADRLVGVMNVITDTPGCSLTAVQPIESAKQTVKNQTGILFTTTLPPEAEQALAAKIVERWKRQVQAWFVPPGHADPATKPKGSLSKVAKPFGLSRRELEVLQAVAQGNSNEAIGSQLYISPRTVQSHIQTITSKMKVQNRTEATRLAFERGLLSEEPNGPVKRSDESSSPEYKLTPRESQILECMANGLQNDQIARLFNLSYRTVQCHNSNIFTKLEVPNRTSASRLALEKGLVAPRSSKP